MSREETSFQSIRWEEDHLTILDQTFLPDREVYIDLDSVGQVWDAIKKQKVRGAPVIGIAGAYGLYFGVQDLPDSTFQTFYSETQRIADYIKSAQPTVMNLSWSLKRMLTTIYALKEDPISDIKDKMLETAITIHDEDRRTCKSIGEHGVDLVPEDAGILTHDNTGGLATGEYGTALSVILHAHGEDKLKMVWVNETRPLLQGARLTAWELKKTEVPQRLQVDSAAANLMKNNEIDLVIVGADRISSLGDTFSRIGTYSLAVLANAHDIPFYVAAPLSTVDMELKDSDDFELEEREPEEVTHFANKGTAPDKVDVYNPAFDITPHNLITAFITEKGIIKPEFKENFEKLLN
ncbi:MAG: S-methyl-5-thioribose-1-phosphate isomerase [Balneolaceae bacterium]|nr:S-methyl-5-thioribose-1-phosphate isomerase [Balneolaceae bacterium]